MSLSAIASTPFHARTAEHNLGNFWVTRGGFTVPASLSTPAEEALAAHVSAILSDVTPVQRLRIYGEGAVSFLARAFAYDTAAILPGAFVPVSWRNDAGAVRGIGKLARSGGTNFVLTAQDTDSDWFETAAPRFNAIVRDETSEKGVLLLTGPLAARILEMVGLGDAVRLPDGAHGIFVVAGIVVGVSCVSPLRAYEIVCSNDDAIIVFDLLWHGGKTSGLVLAGEIARETLLLEAGIPLSGIDFTPARSGTAREPTPASLALEESSRAQDGKDFVLTGLEIEGVEPIAFAPIFRDGVQVGRSLRSAYSPALRRAIALASLSRAAAKSGTEVVLRRLLAEDVKARVRVLPFLA